MIYILFGPPGVGKTYIGNLLHRKLRLPFYDADDQITDREWCLLRAGRYNQWARNKFIERLKDKARYLSNKYNELIIAEAFTKEVNRVDFYRTFKNKIKFIKVFAPKSLAGKRTVGRFRQGDHVITKNLFEYFWRIFDEPQINYDVLRNTDGKDQEIIKEFLRIKSVRLKKLNPGGHREQNFSGD